MDVTKELAVMLDAEDLYIKGLKGQLAESGKQITQKTEYDLRMGFRTRELVNLEMVRTSASGEFADEGDW